MRYWLLALALCAIAVIVCIAYVDRPVAEFFETHVRDTRLWIWLDRALLLLGPVVLLALFFLVGCGISAISGRQVRPWTELPLLCSWSAMWAIAAEMIFKRIFGRGAADPTYAINHLYGFHLLNGGPYWESFPSGTAAVSTAIVAVLWILRPRWRLAVSAAPILLSAAVVITNYHWVSDVIAGAFLGASIGWFTVRLGLRDRN
jgi:membrane-associated phospholipid phosphatase